jgi:tetratricopeptide (TPR) repeat protein
LWPLFGGVVRSLPGLPFVLALALSAMDPGGTAAQQPPSPAPSRKTSATASDVERRLLEAVRLHPESFEAHRALASFYLQRSKLAAALPHLQAAQRIDPSQYANGYDLALVLLQTGKLPEARDQATRTLTLKDTSELHNLLGDVEERAGNLVAAAEEYQRAAHIDASEENLFDWGNNLLQLQAFEPATQVFTVGIERYPKSARLHVGLGIAQYSRGQYGAAVTSLCQAVDLAPSDPRPYQFLGEMYGVAPEQGPEITERLGRFVEARPRNPLANLYYALSLWKGQPAGSTPVDMQKVEALLRRAVALDPKLTKGFLELGVLLSDQQRHKEAIPELRRAIHLDPNQPQAHYRLAQAYQRTGQKALAASELKIFERLKGGSR